MPGGSGTPLWHGAGIRSDASIWAAKHACLGRRTLIGSVDGSPRREQVGKAKWNALSAKKGGSMERGFCDFQPGYASAWVILTDLDPQKALVSWYGLRTWTEGGFKDFKRGFGVGS